MIRRDGPIHLQPLDPGAIRYEPFTRQFDEEDPPEPIRAGRMELGELVAQHLSLALDPYPRKPGAELPAEVVPPDEPERRPSPQQP